MNALSLLLDMPRWGRVVFALALGWGIAWGLDVGSAHAATVAFDPVASERWLILLIAGVAVFCILMWIVAFTMAERTRRAHGCPYENPDNWGMK